MPYTIPDFPEDLQQALKLQASREGKSLGEVTLEVLRRGLETKPAQKRRDLQDIVGSWTADPETDQALADQRVVDPRIWR
jgi:hypothetical protein